MYKIAHTLSCENENIRTSEEPGRVTGSQAPTDPAKCGRPILSRRPQAVLVQNTKFVKIGAWVFRIPSDLHPGPTEDILHRMKETFCTL